MSKNQIEVGLDFKDAKKSIDDVMRYFGSKKPNLQYDETTKAFLSGQFKRKAEEAYSSIANHQRALHMLAREVGGGAMSSSQQGRYDVLTRELGGLRSTLARQPQQAARLGLGSAGPVGGGAGRWGGVASGLGLAFGAAGSIASGNPTGLLSAIGGIGGGLLGGGPGAILGKMVGDQLGGIATEFMGKYQGIAPQMMQWRGQGFRASLGKLSGGSKYGYGFEQSAELVNSILGSRGTMGGGRTAGYGNQPGYELLESMQKFGTGYGVSNSAMGGSLGAIRAAGGGDFSQKFAELNASALASKLERGRIGDWLETTSSAITQLANKTFGISTGGVASMMNFMMSGSRVTTPGMASSMIGSLDEQIRNPGQSFGGAATLNIMGGMLRKRGFKGNIPAALQYFQTEGAFGSTAGMPYAESKLGSLSRMMDPRALLREQAAYVLAQEQSIGSVSASVLATNAFPGLGKGANAALQNAHKWGRPWAQQWQDGGRITNADLDRMQGANAKTLADVVGSIEGQTVIQQRFFNWMQIRSGEKVAPLWNSMLSGFGRGISRFSGASDMTDAQPFSERAGHLLGYSPTGERITSNKGYRIDPFTGAKTFHNGWDIVSADHRMHARMGGKVSSVEKNVRGFGTLITVKDYLGGTETYGHGDPSVSAGQTVSAGQDLGGQNMHGRANGPHTHFNYKGVIPANSWIMPHEIKATQGRR